MANIVYHADLDQEQRDALVNMQFVGSAIAMALKHGFKSPQYREELYQEWSHLLNIVQPALWHQLHMGLIPTQTRRERK